MRSTTKKPHNTDRAVKVIRSAKGAGDAHSRKLARMQKKMGNSGLGGKLGEGAATRDLLMSFACERLRVMRGVQQKEHAEFAHVREWFRDVAKGHHGFHLPDPTRWHTAAKTMKAAVIAMCNGNLARGGQLLEQAMEHERAAFDSLPVMVREKLEGEETGAVGAPAALDSLAPDAVSPACNLPQQLVWADRILAVTDTFEELPSLKPKHHPEPEQEEESDDDEGKDKKEGPGGGQTQQGGERAEEEEEDEEEEEEEDKEQGKEKDDEDDETPRRRWWDAGD